MENIYNQRLLTFASHLEQIKSHPEQGVFGIVKMVALENKGNIHRELKIHYNVRYHSWPFEELPVCFDEWSYGGKYGNPLWDDSDPAEGTVASVIDFFDLSLDEFSHLFDIDGFQQINRFGGFEISEQSNGLDISRNIMELVKSRININ
ncbi:MAG: hypothetical protein WAQ28_11220 [Bacteroidia bacterium]